MCQEWNFDIIWPVCLTLPPPGPRCTLSWTWMPIALPCRLWTQDCRKTHGNMRTSPFISKTAMWEEPSPDWLGPFAFWICDASFRLRVCHIIQRDPSTGLGFKHWKQRRRKCRDVELVWGSWGSYAWIWFEAWSISFWAAGSNIEWVPVRSCWMKTGWNHSWAKPLVTGCTFPVAKTLEMFSFQWKHPRALSALQGAMWHCFCCVVCYHQFSPVRVTKAEFWVQIAKLGSNLKKIISVFFMGFSNM